MTNSKSVAESELSSAAVSSAAVSSAAVSSAAVSSAAVSSAAVFSAAVSSPHTSLVGRISICVGFFAVADLILISNAWFLSDDRLLVAMALPLSQSSLAAIWAACSRASPYLRFAVPPLVAVTSWYVLTQILPWGIGDSASAAWAIALAVQTLAIIIAIHLYKDVAVLASRDCVGAGGPKPSRLSFHIRTLMLWTTVIALGFGFVQFGRIEWRWTNEIGNWDFIKAIPFVGVFNALVAVLWLWALAIGSRSWRGAKTVIVLMLIGLLGFLLSHLIGWVSGIHGFSIHESLVLAAAQSCLIAGSLAVVLAWNAPLPSHQ